MQTSIGTNIGSETSSGSATPYNICNQSDREKSLKRKQHGIHNFIKWNCTARQKKDAILKNWEHVFFFFNYYEEK